MELPKGMLRCGVLGGHTRGSVRRLSGLVAADEGRNHGKTTCNTVSISLVSPAVKPDPDLYVVDGQCTGGNVCPLSRVQEGATVCIKQLSTGPEVSVRLREMGLCEQQRIKLVSRDSSFICQVCNARLGISQKLADSIMVETVSETAVQEG